MENTMLRWSDFYQDEPYNPPEKQITYFYYFNGKVVGEFNTITEIISYCKLNKLDYNRNRVEKVIINEQKIVDYTKLRAIKQREASEKWHNALRDEFSSYPDKVYNLMYSQAYDRGHSYGYNEIYRYMIDISCFIDEIKDAYAL